MNANSTYNLLLEKYRYEIEHLKKLAHKINPNSLLSLFQRRKKTPTTVLIVGTAAIGKTELAKIFFKIAEDEDLNRIWIDWREEYAKYNHWFIQESYNVENFFKAIYSSFRNAEYGKYFSDFEQYSTLLKDAERKFSDSVDIISTSKETPQSFEKLRGFAASTIRVLVGSNVLGPAYNLVPDTLKESADGAISETIKSMAISLAKARLNKKEYDVYINGTERLLDGLAKGIKKISEIKPIIIVLDHYELIMQSDVWIRSLIKKSGPYVIWVVTSQTSTTIPIYENYRNDNYLSDGLIDIVMTQLSIGEVEEIVNHHPLKKRNATTGEIRKIYQASSGNLLALNIALDLWHPGGINNIEVLDPPHIRSRLASPVFERYMFNALNQPEDRLTLSVLSFCYKSENNLLQTLIGENSNTIITNLSRSYPHLFSKNNQLTTSAKYWIREDLLQNREQQEFQKFFISALEWWERELLTYETDHPDIAWCIEQEKWKELALATAYHSFWVDQQFAYETILGILQSLIFGSFITMANFINTLWNAIGPLQNTNPKLTSLIKLFQYGILNLIFRQDIPSESKSIKVLNGNVQDENGIIIGEIGPDTTYKALNLLESRLSENNIKSIGVKIVSAKYHASSGNYDTALALLDLARSRLDKSNFPETSKFIGQAYKDIGRILGNTKAASNTTLKCLLKAKELLGEDVNLLNGISLAYFELCKYDEAIQIAERAIAMDPSIGACYNVKGSALHMQGKNLDALAAYSEGLKHENQPLIKGILLTNLGIINMDLGQHEEAEKQLNNALSCEPGLSSALIAKSLLEYQRNPERAILELRKSIEFINSVNDYYVNTVLLIISNTNDQTALEIIRSVLSRRNLTRGATAKLALEEAVRLSRLGFKSEALITLQKVINIEPRYLPAYFMAGDICKDMNKYREARGYYILAIEANAGGISQFFRTNLLASTIQKITPQQIKGLGKNLPKSQKHGPEALIQHGISNLLRGKISEASQNFKLAIKNSPDDFFLYLALSQIEATQNDLPAASRYAENAIIRSEEGHKGFLYYNLALIKQAQGQLEEAIVLFKKAIEDYKINYFKNLSIATYIYFDLALCLLKTGNESDAIDSLEKAHAIDPLSWPGRLSKIILLMKQNNYTDDQEAIFEVRRLERDLNFENEIDNLKSSEYKSQEMGEWHSSMIIYDVIRPVLMAALIVGDDLTVNKILYEISNLSLSGLEILESLEIDNPIYGLSPINWNQRLTEVKNKFSQNNNSVPVIEVGEFLKSNELHDGAE